MTPIICPKCKTEVKYSVYDGQHQCKCGVFDMHWLAEQVALLKNMYAVALNQLSMSEDSCPCPPVKCPSTGSGRNMPECKECLNRAIEAQCKR